MTDAKNVLIVAETREGGLAPVTFELLTIARELTSVLGPQSKIAAVLPGAGVSSLAQSLIDHGADLVYVVDNPLLAEFHPETFVQAVSQVIEQVRPEAAILGQTPGGRDLAPRLAARFNTGVVMNCIELRPQPDGGLAATCPVFGGDARAVYQFDDARPRIMTIQARVFDPAPAQSGRQGDLVNVAADLSGVTVHTKTIEHAQPTGPKLEDATILVSGGRGLGEKENYRYIVELAEVLGGLPAASRAIVDLGWATPAQQVGLTGKYVAPELYIAIGISGASQHIAGLSSARNIVAINRDGDAPIFRYARYGVVTDCLEFLPVFIGKCREVLGK